MRPKRLFLFMSALSLLLLGLFVQVKATSAVNNQFDEADEIHRSTVSSLPRRQQLVAHVRLNEIELQAEGSEVQALGHLRQS